MSLHTPVKRKAVQANKLKQTLPFSLLWVSSSLLTARRLPSRSNGAKGKRRSCDHLAFYSLGSCFMADGVEMISPASNFTSHHNSSVDGLLDFFGAHGSRQRSLWNRHTSYCVMRSMQSVAKYRRIKYFENLCHEASNANVCAVLFYWLSDEQVRFEYAVDISKNDRLHKGTCHYLTRRLK